MGKILLEISLEKDFESSISEFFPRSVLEMETKKNKSLYKILSLSPVWLKKSDHRKSKRFYQELAILKKNGDDIDILKLLWQDIEWFCEKMLSCLEKLTKYFFLK